MSHQPWVMKLLKPRLALFIFFYISFYNNNKTKHMDVSKYESTLESLYVTANAMKAQLDRIETYLAGNQPEEDPWGFSQLAPSAKRFHSDVLSLDYKVELPKPDVQQHHQANTMQSHTEWEVTETVSIAQVMLQLGTKTVETFEPPAKPIQWINVNTPMVPFNKIIGPVDYHALVSDMLEKIQLKDGSMLKTKKQHYELPLFLKTLYYINRPACFHVDPWLEPRPEFKSVQELNYYMARMRYLIKYFFHYICVGIKGHPYIVMGHQAEPVSDQVLCMPRKVRSVLTRWLANIAF